MKFSCDKNTLMQAVNLSSRAVSSKSSMPILEGLLFKLSNNLTISGYDLNIGITTTIEVDSVSLGNLVINARLLSDILRKLSDDTIYIESDENLLCTIKCGKAIFNLTCSSADDFPEIPEVEQNKAIKIPQKTLKSMISGTIFAVSDNDSKPIHTGCLFDSEDDFLNIVAVDGYRLALRKEEVKNLPKDTKFVVPAFALREIERILDETDDEISIYPDKKHILFEIGDTIIITRLLEGEFLAYKSAIPQNQTHVVGINRSEMLKCLERVSLIISERLKNPVRLNFDGDLIKMSCITAIGKSYDECTISAPIENIEIGFNNRYISDALRACTEENVQMSITSPLNPVVFTPEENNNFVYLVLPVRLRENDN